METSEERTVAIPESITIGGISYVVRETPELLQFMQTVAKVEKNKMYSQMAILRKQIDDLAKTPISSTPLDVTALTESLKQAFVTKDDLAVAVKEAIQPVIQFNQQTQQETIASFREKLLQENDGKCIPELVKGNTKEEILSSLEYSKDIFSKYGGGPMGRPQPAAPVVDPALAKQAAELTPDQIAPAYVPPTPAPAPKVAAPEFTGGTALDTVKALTPEEYAAKREELIATAAKLYGN